MYVCQANERIENLRKINYTKYASNCTTNLLKFLLVSVVRIELVLQGYDLLIPLVQPLHVHTCNMQKYSHALMHIHRVEHTCHLMTIALPAKIP